MPLARQSATQALKLDPNLAEAHVALAIVAAQYDYDWPSAQREFLAALRLNPSDPYAHLFYSASFLSPHRRHQDAIAEVQNATALDPLSPPIQSFIIRTLIWAGRYDDARSQFEKLVQAWPNQALLHERGAHLFACTGDLKSAIEEDAKARLLYGEPSGQVMSEEQMQFASLRQQGDQGYWRAQLVLARQKFQPPESYATPFGQAIIYARLGERDAALSSLEQAFGATDPQLVEIEVEPAFASLQNEPRFRRVLERLQVP
jgi:serine/threonine-protein kinase